MYAWMQVAGKNEGKVLCLCTSILKNKHTHPSGGKQGNPFLAATDTNIHLSS